MTTKVVILEVDEGTLQQENPDSSFEAEMGWVKDSGIHMQDTYTIPEGLEDVSPIETVWIMREVDEHIAHLKASGEITEISKEKREAIIKEIQGNYESIEQDMIWKINDFLGIEQ